MEANQGRLQASESFRPIVADLSGMSREDWELYLVQLSRLERSIQFAIGDALLFGMEKMYIARGKYQKVSELTGIPLNTLKNYVYVARRYTLDQRRDAVSFSTHKAMAHLGHDEREVLLDHIEERGIPLREAEYISRRVTDGHSLESVLSEEDVEQVKVLGVVEDEPVVDRIIHAAEQFADRRKSLKVFIGYLRDSRKSYL